MKFIIPPPHKKYTMKMCTQQGIGTDGGEHDKTCQITLRWHLVVLFPLIICAPPLKGNKEKLYYTASFNAHSKKLGLLSKIKRGER